MRFGRILAALSLALAVGCTDSSPREKTICLYLDTLSQGDPDARIAAAVELARLCATSAVPGLIRAANDVRPDVSMAAVEALVEIGDPRASEALVRQLRAGEWRTRQLAAQGLGRFKSARVIPRLVEAVRDEHAAVAAASAAALVSCGGMSELKAVAASTDETLSAREAALLVLGESGPDGLDTVRRAIGDSNAAVRVAAYGALIRTGGASEVPLLVKGLFDPAASVRKTTEKAILAMEPEMVTPALTELIENGNPVQQTAVLQMLESDRTARGSHVLAAALVNNRANVRTSARAILERRRRQFPQQRDVRLLPAEPLLKAVSSTNGAVREAAISLLETDALVNKSVEPVLRKTLKDPNPEVRAASARLIAAVGADGLEEVLAPLLDDSDAEVRNTAAVTLLPATNQVAVSLAAGELRRCLEESVGAKNEKAARDMKERILKLTSLFAQTGSRQALPALIEGLGSGDDQVLTSVIAAIGKLGDKSHYDAIAPFLALNGWGEQGVKSAAIHALGNLDPSRAAGDLVPHLSQSDRLPGNFSALCRVLGGLKEPRAAEPMLDRLREHYANQTGRMNEIKLAAAAGLVELGEQAVPALIRRLNDTKIREGALAMILGRIGEPAREPLVAALRSEDRLVRKNAAWSFGYLKTDSGAVAPLMALLADGDADVRAAAAWALGQMQAKDAVERLKALSESAHGKDRQAAAEAMGRIGSFSAVSNLVALLRDAEPDVRLAAVTALGLVGDKSAVGPLTELWKTAPDDKTRYAAAEALSALGVAFNR
jgi:HEAT repeat protein